MKNMRKKEEEPSSSVLTKEKTFEYVAQAHAKGARMRPRQTFFYLHYMHNVFECNPSTPKSSCPKENEIFDATFLRSDLNCLETWVSHGTQMSDFQPL